MMSKIKYFIKKFDFLRSYNSPFKPLKLKFYYGPITKGTPYFLPRKWVRYKPADAIEAATKDMNNPKLVKKTFKERYDSYMKSQRAVPKKIGFDFVPMRWKTKWEDTDYRFESGPLWSFVFLNKQITVEFTTDNMTHYWECWLYYTYSTDKNNTVEERLEQARTEFPCVWRTSKGGVTEKVCYWNLILKEKWIKKN